jgi:hypothetical protein
MSSESSPSQYSRLAFLDNVTDDGLGLLILSSFKNEFYISWSRELDHHSPLHQAMRSPGDWPEDIEHPGKSFTIGCRKIKSLILLDPLTLQFELLSSNTTFKYRILKFTNLKDLGPFIEQLICLGIAVISSPYRLQFFPDGHSRVFPPLPPTIQLRRLESPTLKDFWDNLLLLTNDLFHYLGESGSLPLDPQFPLGVPIQVLNSQILSTFENDAIPTEKVTFLNADGEIIDKQNFRANVYRHGVTQSELPILLPYIVGLYDVNWSSEKVSTFARELSKEFSALKEQTALVNKSKLSRNRLLSDCFRVIAHDSHRTDRRDPAFANENGSGLLILSQLLQTYVIFNPTIGYLQGMNDLFVPLILAYFPRWNDVSEPIDSNEKVVNCEETGFLSIIFWCFDALLRNVNHLGVLRSVTQACHSISTKVIQIIEKVSPLVVFWLKRYKLDDFPWIFADLVLLFKRTFTPVWDLWCILNCAPDPANWMCYVIAGIILLTFELFASPVEIVLTELMAAFPGYLAEIDLKKLGRLALVLYEKMPLEPVNVEERKTYEGTFKFFKPFEVNE